MKTSLSGRADLLCSLARDDPSLTAAMSDVLGYDEIPTVRLEPSPVTVPVSPLSPTVIHEPEDVLRYEPADVAFWRLETYEAVVHEGRSDDGGEVTPKWVGWQTRPAERPGFTPLASERVVLTRLRQVPAVRRTTREIDVEAVVDQLSRGRLLDNVPQRQWRTWGSEIYIVEDRARRLVPYWLDQEYVTSFLRYIYPMKGVTVARIGDDEREPGIRWPKERRGQYVPPLPGTMVCVLGDLGCLANEGEALWRFWLHWGRQLRAQHIPAVALVPALARDIPRDLAQVWTVVRWDAASVGNSDIDAASAEVVVARLLTLLSPVVRLEPGLLRAVRCLLPEGRRDAGLEARVWQSAAIASRHSVAATWDPEQRRVYQSGFAREPKGLRYLVLDRIRSWRADLHEAVWFEEVIGLDPQSQGECIDETDLSGAREFVTSFANAVSKSSRPSPDTAAWILRLTERLPTEAWQRYPGIQRMYDLARSRDADSSVPLGYDPSATTPSGQAVRHLTLWQVAHRLLLQPADAQAVPRGSLLGAVQTASGEVMITPGQRESPSWAHRWGRDDIGPWVTFHIGEVEQRMRWIPAGRFTMGSPEDEDGRFSDEGPQARGRTEPGFLAIRHAVYAGALAGGDGR